MIRRWHLHNFKAFRNHDPVEFSMINVLAGANSSGKSTLIQSILLLKQTLQYGSENRPLALNGPLLRLGGFDDVRNFEAAGESLEIGFDIELTDQELQTARGGPWVKTLRRQGISTEAEGVRAVTLKLAFREKSSELRPGAASLNPDLYSTEISTYRISSEEPTGMSHARYTRRDAPGLDDEDPNLPFHVDVDQGSVDELSTNRPDAQIKSGTATSFLPAWVAIRFNSAARDIIQLVEGIFAPSELLIDSGRITDEQVPTDAATLINNWLQAHDAAPVEGETPLATEVREALLPFIRQTRRSANALGGLLKSIMKPNEQLVIEIGQLRVDVLQTLLANTPSDYDYEFDVPRSVSRVSEYLRDFFKQGIRYLGPLRDNPRPVYQLEALESTTDVGYRGEHTAAILDLNKGRSVRFRVPPSDRPEEDYAEQATVRQRPLHDAVVEWLTYLGVASEVATIDAGVYGNRLQVATDEFGRLHDLTNVGVGVSQVLPIVVMALLAPPGSFLIFEQPELHLHPKVQARLADFFLALALEGKQILLETHSEYLVDRFRLRIALSQTARVRDLVNILFSEKVGSNTKLEPVEISEFGAVVNWPKDFFEQSQRDVGRIVKAASSKRRAKPKS
jgi:predicted ATPase